MSMKKARTLLAVALVAGFGAMAAAQAGQTAAKKPRVPLTEE